ncbi:MAG TPA: hypothetical protein VFK02_01770, partial [Kofleriaceae bacterium]|nr:hypothetical protein [Kofleriaceae bacterium]
MPSRLSSLLVRDGLVGVKRMEKAFQRQVIYGGSLDTILLEMGLVPEDRLTQYLALASGLPPAARDEGNVLDPGAVDLITRDLAERYRVVPVAFEQEAIRVLVCSPLELAELEDLADLLDRPLQPLITPEYRWNLAFASAYGLDPPARFSTLARTIDVDPAAAPVGRAPTIIVDERSALAAPLPQLLSSPDLALGPTGDRPRAPSHGAARLGPVPSDAETLKLMAAAAAAPNDEIARARRHTIMGVIPNRAVTDGAVPPGPDEITPPSGTRRPRTGSGPTQGAAPPGAGAHPATSSGTHAHPDSGARAVPGSGAHASGSGAHAQPGSGAVPRQGDARPSMRGTGPAPRPTPIPTEGRDTPLPIVRAREILATAEDRDTVFLTLLRAARSRARWAGLLTVQGGAAIGRVALAEPGIDAAAVNTVLIPLDTVSPFRTVVTNHQSHIGPLVSGDPSIDSMVLRMGGTMPPSALILPIVLRDRVVALVVAHRLHSDLKLVDVTELLPMANAASEAIGRLIVKHKAAGYRAPAEPATVEIDTELIDTRRISRSSAEWRAPTGPPSVPGFEQGVEMSIEAGEPRPIDEVLTDIERANELEAEDALAEAVERAPEALRALVRRFPGKLRIDRFAVTGRPLRAAQYGGLLELVIRLGEAASDLLIDRMGAPQRDVRFYAAVCAAELR